MSVDTFIHRNVTLSSKKEEIFEDQEQFLRFFLVPDTTLLLPVQQLTEVLTIPIGTIVPIPHLPPWVMGVYNWRGKILWMLDLGHLLGLIPWHQQQINSENYTAIVLESANNSDSESTEKKVLGAIVNRIEEIEWCSVSKLQSPPANTVNSSLLPFLQGYWLKDNGEMLIVIDGEAIIAAMPQ
jgi:positive phototaxis protein PixI